MAGQVSILVVVDWVQRPRGAARMSSCRLTFQSLLSWIGFKDKELVEAMKSSVEVSILVVVDWVQRLSDSIRTRQRQ